MQRSTAPNLPHPTTITTLPPLPPQGSGGCFRTPKACVAYPLRSRGELNELLNNDFIGKEVIDNRKCIGRFQK